MKQIILVIFLFLSFSLLFAQNRLNENLAMPEIGKPLPPFKLDNVKYFSKSKVSLSDFKGKWLFLDFWFPGCVTCIRSFPKVNEWKKKFRNKAEFVLIGINKFQGIEELYEKLRAKQHLELVAAFDSTLAIQWEIYAMPRIYIIDPNGNLNYITAGTDLTEEKIRTMIDGEKISIIPSQSETQTIKLGVNLKQPDAFDSTVLFQSILTKHLNGQRIDRPSIDAVLKFKHYVRKGYKASGIPLWMIYMTAYMGNCYWPKTDSLYEKNYTIPLLEMDDTTILAFDNETMNQRYNYSLDIPDSCATKERIMSYMQADLKRYFGYKATIETREMPVWKLVTKSDYKGEIKNVDSITVMPATSSAAGFTAKNMKWKDFLFNISYHFQEFDYTPFFDETGINYNINISINALMTDINEVKKALNKYGLDLIKTKKSMKVLMIDHKSY